MGIKANSIRAHNLIHNAKEERAIKITQYLNEAADLMELEEAGLLIHLPCKAGDTFYMSVDGIIADFVVTSITKPEIRCNTARGVRWSDLQMADFGKKAFLNREDAEQCTLINKGEG